MENDDELMANLCEAAETLVGENYPLSQACTFRIGGPARYFCAPASGEALRAVVMTARQAGLPVFILGGGSNVLFKDEGFPGLVASTQRMAHVLASPDGSLRVGSGLLNRDLTTLTLLHRFTGFEWAGGLPGSVGGGAYMNAKCYGRSFDEIVRKARVFSLETGEWITLSQNDCAFAYKDSVFQHKPYVLTDLQLEFTPGDPEAIRQETERVLADRKAKGQFEYPSAGCVFKNDYSVGVSSGKLIEESGLKGRSVGGVKVFEQHANFIVNTGTGTAKDVRALMDIIKAEVRAKKGVDLEEEVRVVG